MVKVEKTESLYFKGEFANKNSITEVMFVTEPKEVEKTFNDETEMKIQGRIEYEGYKDGLPNIWELNNTSKNIMIDCLGDDTLKWMGVPIPIVSSIGGNGKWQILVDSARLKKSSTSSEQKEIVV